MVFGIHWKQKWQTEKKIAYTFLEMQVFNLMLLGLKMTIFCLCHSEQAV